jgi:hypothetical protein
VLSLSDCSVCVGEKIEPEVELPEVVDGGEYVMAWAAMGLIVSRAR